MINIILALMFFGFQRVPCEPYLKIDVAGATDVLGPYIVICDQDNRTNKNYQTEYEIKTEINKEIKEYNANIFYIEKKYIMTLVKSFNKQFITQQVANRKKLLNHPINRISFTSSNNKTIIYYMNHKDTIVFLKELKKIFNKRYQKEKSRLKKYNIMLDDQIRDNEGALK